MRPDVIIERLLRAPSRLSQLVSLIVVDPFDYRTVKHLRRIRPVVEQDHPFLT